MNTFPHTTNSSLGKQLWMLAQAISKTTKWLASSLSMMNHCESNSNFRFLLGKDGENFSTFRQPARAAPVPLTRRELKLAADCDGKLNHSRLTNGRKSERTCNNRRVLQAPPSIIHCCRRRRRRPAASYVRRHPSRWAFMTNRAPDQRLRPAALIEIAPRSFVRFLPVASQTRARPSSNDDGFGLLWW